MNSNRMPFVLMSVLALMVFMSGCAKPPTAEMEAAQAALTRAENDADALAYGSPSLIRARDALANMQSEAKAKKYESAKTYAQEVINAADRAIADGKTGVQRARDEATNLLNGVQAMAGETQKNIANARSSNVRGLDFTTINGDFTNAQIQVNEAQAALTRADYRGSIDRSQSARAILGSIDSRLTQTSIAASRKK